MSGRGVLRLIEGGLVAFWCAGCECMHGINIDPQKGHPCWDFNGDYDAPTFSPSIKVTSRGMATEEGRQAWRKFEKGEGPVPGPEYPRGNTCCHTFVRSGFIEYLADCTHALKGQTVQLEALDANDDAPQP